MSSLSSLPQQLPLFELERCCPRCGTRKPLDARYFYRRSDRPGGFHYPCKECMDRVGHKRRTAERAERRAARRARREKRCPTCHVVKPLTEEFFVRRSDRTIGFHSRCKDCMSISARAWHAENREQANAALRARRAQSHEQWRAYCRAWYWAHREACLTKERHWRLSHAEALRLARLVAYRAASDETRLRWKVNKAMRRARQRGAAGYYNAADITALHTQQAGCCAYCGTTLGPVLHIDHKIPLSRGGSNWPDNLCLSCPTCNLRKKDKTPEEFHAYLAACRT